MDIIEKLTSANGLDKKVKDLIASRYASNDKILSILALKKIMNDKKMQLIEIITARIEVTKSNVFKVVPHDLHLIIMSYLDNQSLLTLLDLQVIKNKWLQKYITNFGKIKRVIDMTLWKYYYYCRLNSICIKCSKKTVCIEPFYNISICIACRKLDERFTLVVLTTLKTVYKLKPSQIESLEYITVPNPHFKCAPKMKLYLKSDIYTI
jgi:hypothetical protein